MREKLCLGFFLLGITIFVIAVLNIVGLRFAAPVSPEAPRDELAEQIRLIDAAARNDL